MEVIKLLIVFTVIVIVLKLKKPLSISIIAGTIATTVLFQISIKTFLSTLLNSATSWNTISILLVFYIITFLQRMLEKRGSLHLAQQSLDRLFNNRRITASLAPLFLGLLPSASAVVICGEVVQKSVGDYLPKEEKAFITSFYRHIPESVLPTFSSIIIAINLTQGAVTVGSFIIGMIPMVVALLVLGYIFYLRRIPKETMMPPSNNKWKDFLNLSKGLWPIVLIIALILIFNVPVYIAAAISILLFIFTDHFKLSELKPFVKSAFEANLLISTFFIMLFKDVLSATGVISALPDLFSKLPIPEFLIFSLIFFIGTVVSGSQAIAVIGIPLVFMAMPHAGLPIFILLMGVAFAANQVTPTHICLAITAEYFNINFGDLVKKSIPVVISFCSILLVYYFFLMMFF